MTAVVHDWRCRCAACQANNARVGIGYFKILGVVAVIVGALLALGLTVEIVRWMVGLFS